VSIWAKRSEGKISAANSNFGHGRYGNRGSNRSVPDLSMTYECQLKRHKAYPKKGNYILDYLERKMR
jgi:hypothetical protein